MSDYLVYRAIRDVWCSPDQDRQARIVPRKISIYGGAVTEINVMWRRYKLPLAATRFNVYQIGAEYPTALGLADPEKQGVWVLLSDVCIANKLIVDLYNNKGIQMPRTATWYMVTHDNNLIFALQEQTKIPFYPETEDLCIRFYSNAYYNSDRSSSPDDYIDVQGMQVRTTEDILSLQNKYDALNRKKGLAYAFVNGYRVSKPDMISVKLGDYVEVVYDGSIYTVVDFRISALNEFTSTLDNKRKYLLHPAAIANAVIDFHDDVDFFLYKPEAGGRLFKGVYYHRNAESADAVRQITHRDWSVPVAYVAGYQAGQEGWDDANDLVLRAHIRHAGFARPLVNEANRINELYKLTDEEILRAMNSIDAVVPEWHVDHLESSAYTRLMGADSVDITPQLAQQAFGYNAMALMLAPTPRFTRSSSGQNLVNIPVNLEGRSCMYEFNADGELTGWFNHTIGNLHVADKPTTRLVEMLTGYGVNELDEHYGVHGMGVDSTLDYRMYKCGMFAGTADNKWVDVTGGPEYVISNNQLTWLIDPEKYYTMVRSNRDFLAYDLNVGFQSGTLRFQLQSMQKRGEFPILRPMQIPMGELYLWMNGKALIEGIDYIVQFPEILITNKRYLVRPSTDKQKIHVRFCGHSRKDFSREVCADVGFVQHGVLSNNSRFDIRDDKVQHITVGGEFYDKSELSFAETHSGVNVQGVKDGTPYVIRDIVVPMRGTTNANTYVLRDAALITDKHVADYLTLKLPPPVFTEIMSIENLYPVYSPFTSALLADLATKLLDDPRMYGAYSDNVVKDICKSYEHLLGFDQATPDHKADAGFMIVHANYQDIVTTLTLFQYRFLLRAVKIYLNDAVNLSHYVNVTA